jgi:membrane-associated phospholipid phosphatase
LTPARKCTIPAAMTGFDNPWPLGLTGRNWPYHALLVGAVLIIVLPFDHKLSLLATGAPPLVVAAFNDFTRWGMADWILIPSLLVVALVALAARLERRRRQRLALFRLVEIFGFVFVGVAAPSLVANLLKHLIGRARPYVFDEYGLFGLHPFMGNFYFESFPSGHSTTAASLAIVVVVMAPRLWPPAFVYALAIMASRVIIGAHYPTDVLAGMVTGSIGAYAVRNYFARRRWGFAFGPDGRVRMRSVRIIPAALGHRPPARAAQIAVDK